MNRFAKFLNIKFKVEHDKYGVPSIIMVNGDPKSLVQSLDRVRMKAAMSQFLVDKMALSDEFAIEEAEKYIEDRYKEYMDFVLNM